MSLDDKLNDIRIVGDLALPDGRLTRNIAEIGPLGRELLIRRNEIGQKEYKKSKYLILKLVKKYQKKYGHDFAKTVMQYMAANDIPPVIDDFSKKVKEALEGIIDIKLDEYNRNLAQYLCPLKFAFEKEHFKTDFSSLLKEDFYKQFPTTPQTAVSKYLVFEDKTYGKIMFKLFIEPDVISIKYTAFGQKDSTGQRDKIDIVYNISPTTEKMKHLDLYEPTSVERMKQKSTGNVFANMTAAIYETVSQLGFTPRSEIITDRASGNLVSRIGWTENYKQNMKVPYTNLCDNIEELKQNPNLIGGYPLGDCIQLVRASYDLLQGIREKVVVTEQQK